MTTQTNQVVVSSGVVIAVYPPGVDLYPLYPTDNSVQYFDYVGLPTGSVLNTISITQIVPPVPLPNLNDGLVDPATGINPLSQDPTQLVPFVTVSTGQEVDSLDLPPDPRLAMTLSAAQATMISMISKIVFSKVNTAYPYLTQLAIIGTMTNPATNAAYTGTDLTNMKAVLNPIFAQQYTENTAVNALGSVSAVIAYNPFF